MRAIVPAAARLHRKLFDALAKAGATPFSLAPSSFLVAEEELYRGSLGQILIEPRAILGTALKKGAPKVLIFHSHPSNDPTPSSDDLEFTQRLAVAGEVLGIRLVEHLIITPSGAWEAVSKQLRW